jgi:hypothetical protein
MCKKRLSLQYYGLNLSSLWGAMLSSRWPARVSVLAVSPPRAHVGPLHFLPPLHSLSFHIPCFILHDIHGARGLHRQALSVTVAGPADRWGSINRQVDGMCQSTWGSSDGPRFPLRTPVVRRPACSSSLDLGSGEPGVLYHGGARRRTRWLLQVGSQRQGVG